MMMKSSVDSLMNEVVDSVPGFLSIGAAFWASYEIGGWVGVCVFGYFHFQFARVITGRLMSR